MRGKAACDGNEVVVLLFCVVLVFVGYLCVLFAFFV